MFAVVRVRGGVNVNPKIKRTLELLRLFRVNHLVLVDEKCGGMLEQAQSFVTWGEIDAKTLALLLERRGRVGGKRLGREFLAACKCRSFKELAERVLGGKLSLDELGLKPVFRLRPPRKGFERVGIKKSYSVGGALGYRASDINELVRRMA